MGLKRFCSSVKCARGRERGREREREHLKGFAFVLVNLWQLKSTKISCICSNVMTCLLHHLLPLCKGLADEGVCYILPLVFLQSYFVFVFMLVFLQSYFVFVFMLVFMQSYFVFVFMQSYFLFVFMFVYMHYKSMSFVIIHQPVLQIDKFWNLTRQSKHRSPPDVSIGRRFQGRTRTFFASGKRSWERFS